MSLWTFAGNVFQYSASAQMSAVLLADIHSTFLQTSTLSKMQMSIIFPHGRPQYIKMGIHMKIRRLRVRPPLGWQHSFMEIDHLILSTVSLSLLLIQEGQLSVSGERMTLCTILVNCLEDLKPAQ